MLAWLVGDFARILDGSFVEAPKQRNTREENYQIKKNDKTADELWGDNPFKARQKDTDARWTKKRSELHYGYKAHVYADEQSKFIIFLKTTPANVHDSQVLEDVLSDEDAGMEFLADSAYSGSLGNCRKFRYEASGLRERNGKNTSYGRIETE